MNQLFLRVKNISQNGFVWLFNKVNLTKIINQYDIYKELEELLCNLLHGLKTKWRKLQKQNLYIL